MEKTTPESQAINDKYGFGASFLILGLAGALCLLSQLVPESWSFHREGMRSEMIYDSILMIAGLPVGIYFLVQGILSQSAELGPAANATRSKR
jgi:hypothetical protein